VGTIQNYTHQSEAERMSAKAQEVAFDRLLVDRFKGGDQSAFDEMVSRYWVFGKETKTLKILFINPMSTT
jgi:RNA polymerase sigma-70 factor (ECF subfamily)